MFVEVLARVRGEPSAGHSPPAAPSHSDTVTKGDPQIVLYTSPPPPARSDTKTWPGCSQPRSPTGTHMFFSDDTNYQKSVTGDEGKMCYSPSSRFSLVLLMY